MIEWRGLIRCAWVVSTLLGLSGPATDALATDAATFVHQDVPRRMVAGRSYAVAVTMMNSGSSVWSGAAGFRLEAVEATDDPIWGIQATPLQFDEVVECGVEKTFVFTVRAPISAGTHEFQWQMRRDPRDWFGPRSPSVCVTVSDSTADENDSEYLAQMIAGVADPEVLTVSPGRRFYAIIAMRNAGASAWTRSRGYALGSERPAKNSLWGVNRIELDAGKPVPPGGYREFSALMTAPEEEGEYDFQWRMAAPTSSGRSFGEFTRNVRIIVAADMSSRNDAQPAGNELVNGRPAAHGLTLRCGQPFAYQVRMTNTGTTAWSGGDSPRFRLGSFEEGATWGTARIDLEPGEVVPPGATATFRATLVAPDQEGIYQLRWQLVEEEAEWFGEPTAPIEVAVAGCPTAICSGTCPAANPNDAIPDDAALQACINKQNTVRLCPGRPGYILASGLEMRSGKLLTSVAAPTTDKTKWARLVASDDLWAPMIQASGKFGFRIEYLVIDGNKGVLNASGRSRAGPGVPPIRNCAGSDRRGGSTLIFNGCSTFALQYLDVLNTLCGTAVGINGSGFDIHDLHVKGSGFSCPPVAGAYADGITLGLCTDGWVRNNTIEDYSDIGIVSGGGRNCNIRYNTILQKGMAGGTGLALVNFVGEGNGDHTGANVISNVISCSRTRRNDFGLVLGPHPWGLSQSLVSFGGTVESNIISNAVRNLVVDRHNRARVCRNSFTGAARVSSCWFGQEACSAANYSVAHSSGCTLQPGFARKYYHAGGTGCGSVSPTFGYSMCPQSFQPSQDRTAPQLSVTLRHAASRSGIREIAVDAWDLESGVDSVEIWIDGVERANLYSYPYSYDWDTNEETAGPHEVRVKAVNGSGVHAERHLDARL